MFRLPGRRDEEKHTGRSGNKTYEFVPPHLSGECSSQRAGPPMSKNLPPLV